jgi:hypothetical protein
LIDFLVCPLWLCNFKWWQQHRLQISLPGFGIARFFGPLVKLVCGSAELGLIKARQISSFREALPLKSVGIFTVAQRED